MALNQQEIMDRLSNVLLQNDAKALQKFLHEQRIAHMQNEGPGWMEVTQFDVVFIRLVQYMSGSHKKDDSCAVYRPFLPYIFPLVMLWLTKGEEDLPDLKLKIDWNLLTTHWLNESFPVEKK